MSYRMRFNQCWFARNTIDFVLPLQPTSHLHPVYRHKLIVHTLINRAISQDIRWLFMKGRLRLDTKYSNEEFIRDAVRFFSGHRYSQIDYLSVCIFQRHHCKSEELNDYIWNGPKGTGSNFIYSYKIQFCWTRSSHNMIVIESWLLVLATFR